MAMGDFTTWVSSNTISTFGSTDNSTVGSSTYTIKVGDWGVPSVTVPAPAVESPMVSPMSAIDRMDKRLNQVRQRVAA